MKIIIVTDTYYPHVNGCSYFAQRLAYYLQKNGHQILVIAPSLNIYSKFFEHNGVRFFGVSSFPIPTIKDFRFSLPFFQKNKLERIIKEFNPEIIHLQSHFYIDKAVFDITRKNNLPVVGTNHFMPENLVHYLHLPKKMETKIKSFAWKQFRNVFEKLLFITAPTKTAVDLVKKHGFSKEISAISNGIDLKNFNPGKNGEYLREKYNLPKKPSLIFVGRLDKEKNLDFILQTLPEVLKKVDVNFIIAGKGQEKENLEKLAKELSIEKNVLFLGFVPDKDLGNLYNVADCFINACEAELQCIAAMEALACGLPIIGVNAMALPELIHNEENGFLFEPGDSQVLTEKIIQIFSDENLLQKMSEKSLEIIKKHSIDNTINQFEKIYTDAIKINKQENPNE